MSDDARTAAAPTGYGLTPKEYGASLRKSFSQEFLRAAREGYAARRSTGTPRNGDDAATPHVIGPPVMLGDDEIRERRSRLAERYGDERSLRARAARGMATMRERMALQEFDNLDYMEGRTGTAR